MKLSKNVLLALSAVCVLASSGVASAQFTPPTAPEECAAGRDLTAWKTGRTSGESRVASVWKSTAVHQDLDALSDALPGVLSSFQQTLIGLAGGRQVTPYVQCRAQGYADGFFFKLNQLFGQCVIDGADWGSFAASVYCSLSVELGGLAESSLFVRSPVGQCGNLFEFTCEDVYRYVGSEGAHELNPIVTSYLSSQDIVLEPFPGCADFTDGEFLAAFESSLHNDCSYLPVED